MKFSHNCCFLLFVPVWAKGYDSDVTAEGYEAPQRTAELLLPHLQGKHDAILDIGCGTGLSAEPLASANVEAPIDGVDLSEAMLEVARKKEIYRKLFLADFTREDSVRAAFSARGNTQERVGDKYGHALATGTFTKGHVGPKGIEVALELLKPEGKLAFSVNELAFEDGYEEELSRLEKAGWARVISDQSGPYVADLRARYFCLQRL